MESNLRYFPFISSPGCLGNGVTLFLSQVKGEQDHRPPDAQRALRSIVLKSRHGELNMSLVMCRVIVSFIFRFD